MPCFEGQNRDKLKVPPAIAKAFMNEMLDHLKGGLREPAPFSTEMTGLPRPMQSSPVTLPPMSYGDALKVMSEKSGLQVETVNNILRRDPQVSSRTKQAIAGSGDVRRVRDAAEAFHDQLKSDGKLTDPKEPGAIAKAWDLQRTIALKGHSPVFPWTHMRNWAVQIPTPGGIARMRAFWRAATDVYRYGGEKGRALYEMDMGLMQAGDYYNFFKSSGADLEPGTKGAGNILLQNAKPGWTTRNFDALKPARYSQLLTLWDNLDPALKQGETGKAVMSMIARDMNYATGSVMQPIGESATPLAKLAAAGSETAGSTNLLLSSKLFFSKYMDALTPLRYLSGIGRRTMAEKAAVNIALGRWANTVATHLGILGANYAFNKMMGWKTPNLTTPSESDYLRLRLGNNIVVPFSPMLEATRLPIVFTATMMTKGSDEAGSKLWRAIWNAAHPSAHTAYEQFSGRDFRGQPLTFTLRNLATQLGAPPIKDKYGKVQTPVPPGWLEAAKEVSSKGPIAVSGAMHEYFQALKDANVPGGMATAFIKAVGFGLASALAGQHVYEEEERKKTVKKSRGKSAGPQHTFQ